MTARFGALVLAGERPGGGALARALELPAAVLAPLAGRPCLEWVLDALSEARAVDGIRVCGPAREVVEASPELTRLLSSGYVGWVAPAPGPAASARAAAQSWNHYPLLLTSGDHGLLQPQVVDGFCEQAWARRNRQDLVVGLVPFEAVSRAFPGSRRTVLRFADGAFCGSNLFALLGPDSTRALSFWTSVEADRKRPWRMARRLGISTLLRYLLGRLPVAGAFETLSRRAGCRIGWIQVSSARAAVDVDSQADWALADRLLSEESARAPADGSTG